MDLSNEDPYPFDMIAPYRIDHFFEWGDRTETAEVQYWGYQYNYLVYEFREGEATAVVWAYCDEDSTALVRSMEPEDIRSDFVTRVLVFVSMRYERLQWMTKEGRSSLPADVVEKVEIMKSRHMKEHGK